jgi:hypothetical protein
LAGSALFKGYQLVKSVSKEQTAETPALDRLRSRSFAAKVA